MATNFEIILNCDAPVTLANGNKHKFNIEEVIAILETKNVEYSCAPHVPDENSNFNHWHVGFCTKSDNTFETIAKWFNLPVNAVQKITGRFKSTYALYLIHYNKEGKTPVPTDLVRSNWDLNYDKLIKNIKASSRRDDILNGIDNGVIKPHNYTQYVTQEEYVKYNRQIVKAFEYRIDKLKGIDRNMECIFITGDSGTGKTTYAKQIASDRKFSVYISSGSNDVLDDYQGQDCIILDDLRSKNMGLSDLLKMLDNNTASSVKSRFKNKVLECKLIIITTTKTIDQFFNDVFDDAEEKETIKQLKRRCRLYIQMTDKRMFLNMYNPKLGDYEQLSNTPNLVLEQFKNVEEYSDEEKLQLAADILGSTGEMFLNLKQGIENKSFLLGDDVAF